MAPPVFVVRAGRLQTFALSLRHLAEGSHLPTLEPAASPMSAAKTESAKKIVLSRDWRDVDSSPQKAKSLSCNLQKKLACCGGKGYRIAKVGALCAATVCSCVTQCPSCLGTARLIDGNDSRACLRPQPTIVANLINAGRIPAHYAEASLPGFRNFTGNGRQIVADLERWKAQFRPLTSKGLVIEGPIGVGKSYLLAALAIDMAERGLSVRFTDFFQLLGELKAGFSQGKADSAQLAPLIHVDVLFIDELGKGRNNDFDLTILDQLICGRYNQNKTIVATTNYQMNSRSFVPQQDLQASPKSGAAAFGSDLYTSLEQRIGMRIFSRLREMATFHELKGDDWRRDDVRLRHS